LTIDNDGFAYAGTMDGVARSTNSTVIPVELVSFSATLLDINVKLDWSTATETNNSGFEILRSNKKDEWNTIGFVPGNGTTIET